MASCPPSDPVLDELLAECRRHHRGWINGDASGYALPEDGTIMGAVGGDSYGGAATTKRQSAGSGPWEAGVGQGQSNKGGGRGRPAGAAMIEGATVMRGPRFAQNRRELRG